MRNIIPILKREYLTRVMTKGFWISTAILPLFMGAIMILPTLIAAISKTSPQPVIIVDRTGEFFPIFQQVLKNVEDQSQVPPVEKLESKASDADIRRQLNDRAEEGEIGGYIIFDEQKMNAGEVTYYARNPSSAISGGDTLRARFREAVTRYRLEKLGLAPKDIEVATKRVSIEVLKATNDPKKEESGISAFLLSFLLVMFIYFSLIFYGIYVLKGVLEEKSNRIVEVIVSSVKPFHLMTGKILGIGAVGLTQIAIWVVFLLLFTAPQLLGMMNVEASMIPKLNPMLIAFFPIYFVLGFLLYATIYAGIGSMFNSDEDAQQMVGVANLFLIVPIMMVAAVMKNPSGGLATGMSLFPFFTPIIMYLRIAVETPPVWQIALSIVLMIATITLMIWIVSKIYRVGILMYGKKPTLPELVRWLRYT
jgi:ABC-2 type transport system permease protein